MQPSPHSRLPRNEGSDKSGTFVSLTPYYLQDVQNIIEASEQKVRPNPSRTSRLALTGPAKEAIRPGEGAKNASGQADPEARVASSPRKSNSGPSRIQDENAPSTKPPRQVRELRTFHMRGNFTPVINPALGSHLRLRRLYQKLRQTERPLASRADPHRLPLYVP